MSQNVKEIPATEIVERASEIGRVGSTNDDSRIWGAMNDVYIRTLPIKEDWTFFLASSAIACTPKYNTGTVAATTGSTVVNFTGATLTASMTGSKIKLNDNPNLYVLTVTSSSDGTLDAALSEDRNITGGAYVIYQPTYPLAENFSRFPKNGGLQMWRGGKPIPCEETPIQEYYGEYPASPGLPERCRLVAPNTMGNLQVELIPGPDKAYLLPYDYFITPEPLRETTAGSVTVNAGSASAVFHGGAILLEADTGWFFRVDAFGVGAQSKWYRVLSINAVGSAITLQTAFGLSGATSAAYTLCSAPQMPILLHRGLLEGTVLRVITDQDDPMVVVVNSDYSATITDAKRLYKSRKYNQPISTALEDPNFRR